MDQLKTQDIGTLGRRALLGAGAAGAVLGRRRAARAQTPVTLTMTVWAAQAEEEAFNAAIAKYRALHPEVTIKLEVNGNAVQVYQQVDTRLAGRQAPDIFRVQYQQIGRYAAARAADRPEQIYRCRVRGGICDRHSGVP